MIRIHMLTGPQSGLQTTHSETRLTFGRAPQNTIAIDDPHLSRFHGELLFENERWVLVNHSANGCSVNRRKITGSEPHPLKPGDVVSVGATKLFNVQFVPSAAAPVDTPVEQAPKKGMSRRGKLWMAIGIYFALMVLGTGFLAMRGGKGAQSMAMPVQLTPEQVTTIIREKPAVRDRDEREAQRNLVEARSTYANAATIPGAYYRAYNFYKHARAHLHTGLEDTDQLQFANAEEELLKRVLDQYDRAAKLVRNRDFVTGAKAFNDLKAVYPETDGPLAENIREHLRYADAHMPKKNTGFGR